MSEYLCGRRAILLHERESAVTESPTKLSHLRRALTSQHLQYIKLQRTQVSTFLPATLTFPAPPTQASTPTTSLHDRLPDLAVPSALLSR